MLCLCIHRQMVYFDRADHVGVKLSSWPLPLEDERSQADLSAFREMCIALA